MNIEPGKMLDRYELLASVAQGGMGRVWIAKQSGKHGFSRKVALKTILPALAKMDRFRNMLLDEARIASRIDHPNVVRILDLGEADEVLYIVMEWVEGLTLKRLVQACETNRATVPLPVVARILGDMCLGLHAAHELADDAGNSLNVVHRDVSPDNVLVSVTGYARISDFGIAKARERLADETTTGGFRGKVGFVAPEHAMALRIDRRADIWAVGAILYRLLAGRLPFPRIEDLVLLLNGEATLPPLPPTVPLGLVDVAARALAASPEGRFATALEMGEAIAAAMGEGRGAATSEELATLVRWAMSAPADEPSRDITALQATDDLPTHQMPPRNAGR